MHICTVAAATAATSGTLGHSCRFPDVPSNSVLLQGTRASAEASLHHPQGTSHAGHQLLHTSPSPLSASLSPPPCKVASRLSSSLRHRGIHGIKVSPPSTATVTLHPKLAVDPSCRLSFCWTPTCCLHVLLRLSFPPSHTCLGCLWCVLWSPSAVPSTHGALASSYLLLGAGLHRVRTGSSIRVRRPFDRRRPFGGSVQLFL